MKEPTQQYSDTIKSLQSRIQALEDENRLLKERLEEAGVSYEDIVSGDAEEVVELYDPAQDALPEGGLGNVIALPLQGMALKSGNSAFVDESWNAYEDQLKVLAGTRRLTRQEIEDYLSLWYSTGFTSEDNGTDAPWDKNSEIEVGSVI